MDEMIGVGTRRVILEDHRRRMFGGCCDRRSRQGSIRIRSQAGGSSRNSGTSGPQCHRPPWFFRCWIAGTKHS